MESRLSTFALGARHGIPIALGYFAVAFSLGITAAAIGLSPLQGFVSSILNHASAGEYAEFTAIAEETSYFATALIILITNARYLLMSCALSQKFAPGASLFHRLLVGFGITDEIFAIAVMRKGALSPLYVYGAMTVAIPAWAIGTATGIFMGNILPAAVVSALSVALYGMFIAIIFPPAKKNRFLLFLIFISFGLSFAIVELPLFAAVSDSLRIIILTLLISGVAAAVRPVDETEAGA
ncbi:MAG: AzlC family ABC transporter permease [Clostridia bacterium]|nr:AzlC family ABC transporter permease [Clostridia bacterium]